MSRCDLLRETRHEKRGGCGRPPLIRRTRPAGRKGGRRISRLQIRNLGQSTACGSFRNISFSTPALCLFVSITQKAMPRESDWSRRHAAFSLFYSKAISYQRQKEVNDRIIHACTLPVVARNNVFRRKKTAVDNAGVPVSIE